MDLLACVHPGSFLAAGLCRFGVHVSLERRLKLYTRAFLWRCSYWAHSLFGPSLPSCFSAALEHLSAPRLSGSPAWRARTGHGPFANQLADRWPSTFEADTAPGKPSAPNGKDIVFVKVEGCARACEEVQLRTDPSHEAWVLQVEMIRAVQGPGC